MSGRFQEEHLHLEAAQRRLKQEADIQWARQREKVIRTLFEPFQNLRRSLEAAEKGASAESHAEGLRAVVKQFMDAFLNLGLEEVPGKGARFDPNVHEALTVVTVRDRALDNVVIDVINAGWRVGERLITPARVIVGQLPEDFAEPAEEPAAENGAEAADPEPRAEEAPAEEPPTDEPRAEEAPAEEPPADDAADRDPEA